jgi:hypothetical protein
MREFSLETKYAQLNGTLGAEARLDNGSVDIQKVGNTAGKKKKRDTQGKRNDMHKPNHFESGSTKSRTQR